MSTYDLIFANCVFLHFTPKELEMVLIKVYKALTYDGALAFSVKKGEGETWSSLKIDAPRYFCYWDRFSMDNLLQKVGFSLGAVKK